MITGYIDNDSTSNWYYEENTTAGATVILSSGCDYEEEIWEDWTYLREERQYFVSLLKDMFKQTVRVVERLYYKRTLIYRRLLFSISGRLSDRIRRKRC